MTANGMTGTAGWVARVAARTHAIKEWARTKDKQCSD